MSYIEKKYFQKIIEIFDELTENDKQLVELIRYKSFSKVDEIAKVLAELNKKINLILKKYYPEIKSLDEKLEIKSNMKFYYDLLHNLTDYIRQSVNFQKIDNRYYDTLIDFIEKKDSLINNKYKKIVSKELTSFYDKKSREKLERILASKLQLRERNYFTFGALEEEIKKIGMINDFSKITFKPFDEELEQNFDIENAHTVILVELDENKNNEKLEKITHAIKGYLESKSYRAIIKSNSIITNAKLHEFEDTSQ
jgi:hypothetical protein